MKACNFASLDPKHQQRGVKGLKNRSQLEEQIWEQFQADSEAIANQAEAAYEQLSPSGDIAEKQIGTADDQDLELPDGPTESERTIKTRRVQGFFRRAVLASYGHRCCLTGLGVPELLNASHIIPWHLCGTPATSGCASGARADPSNGLCLNALHDRAFDRGLMTFDPDRRVILSKALADDDNLGHLLPAFKAAKGRKLATPDRFAPSDEALAYHREQIFRVA